MRVSTAVLFGLLFVVPLVPYVPTASAWTCAEYIPCCFGVYNPVDGSCTALCGHKPFAQCPAAAPVRPPQVSYCFTKVDDMINDGGTTYCVDSDGPCHVSESTEYIWGREYSCLA